MPLWRDSVSSARLGDAAFTVAVSGLAISVAGIVTVLSRRALREEADSSTAWTPNLLPVSREHEAQAVAATEELADVSSQTQAAAGVEAAAEVAPDEPQEAPEQVASADPPAAAETAEVPTEDAAPATAPTPAASARERLMGLRTLLSSLQACDRVCPDSIMGPFQMNAGTDEVPVVCFQFRMSHFTCKAFLAHGTQDEGSQHLKLQTTFEDNRRSLGEEQRYFIANEWNATKRYTRLKCGSGGTGRSSVFTLEYDVLVPADTPHTWGLSLLAQTLRMWYTSMVACVMHIVEPRDVPFATHEMIEANTLAVTVREEDTCLLDQKCPICFECFTVGEKVRRLPCLHLFHVVGADSDATQSCHCNIDKHLVRDKQCPVCKTSIDFMEKLDKSSPAGKVGEAEALVIPESGDVPAASSTAAADGAAASGSTGLVDLGTATEAGTEVALPSSGREGGAPSGQTMAAVARGAAAHGIAAAAEVAAVVARITPQQGQAQAAGLPAQAIELERAVRSLQSRWMQIQDVVAGMQQMLQYIEESQTMMTAAREQAGIADGEAGAPDSNGEAAAPDINTEDATSGYEAAVAEADAAEARLNEALANENAYEAPRPDVSQSLRWTAPAVDESPPTSRNPSSEVPAILEVSEATDVTAVEVPDVTEAPVATEPVQGTEPAIFNRNAMLAYRQQAPEVEEEVTVTGVAARVGCATSALAPKPSFTFSADAPEFVPGAPLAASSTAAFQQPRPIQLAEQLAEYQVAEATIAQVAAPQVLAQASQAAAEASGNATRAGMVVGTITVVEEVAPSAHVAVEAEAHEATVDSAREAEQAGVNTQPAPSSLPRPNVLDLLTSVAEETQAAEQAPAAAAVRPDAVQAPPSAASQSTEALQTSVMSGLMQAMRVRNAPQQSARASQAPSSGERWQPFTEAEKICMAYMWRGRRDQLLNPAAGLPGDAASESRASS